MGRPSKLTPAQWSEVGRRLLEGETARTLGREFGLSDTAIRKRFGSEASVSSQSLQVRTAAEKLAEANRAIRELTPAQRPVAVSLAERLDSISQSLIAGAELGAKTMHRLHALANSEVAKVDDADPLASVAALKNVGILTKLGNESAHVALSLLSANKDRMAELPKEPESTLPVSALSTEALSEIMRAKDAADRG